MMSLQEPGNFPGSKQYLKAKNCHVARLNDFELPFLLKVTSSGQQSSMERSPPLNTIGQAQ
jgi:hypothetical protein